MPRPDERLRHFRVDECDDAGLKLVIGHRRVAFDVELEAVLFGIVAHVGHDLPFYTSKSR